MLCWAYTVLPLAAVGAVGNVMKTRSLESAPALLAGVCAAAVACIDQVGEELSCPERIEGCPCTPNATCEEGLTCVLDRCEESGDAAAGGSATPHSLVGRGQRAYRRRPMGPQRFGRGHVGVDPGLVRVGRLVFGDRNRLFGLRWSAGHYQSRASGWGLGRRRRSPPRGRSR